MVSPPLFIGWLILCTALYGSFHKVCYRLFTEKRLSKAVCMSVKATGFKKNCFI
jgi:hypothetical protein